MSSFVVNLPPAGVAAYPSVLPYRTFADHDTFAAYLQTWSERGYAITWPMANVANIGPVQ